MPKRIKDSIALAKKLQNSQEEFTRLQNYAAVFLGVCMAFAIGIVVVEFVFLSSLHSPFVFAMAGMVLEILVLTIYGFISIFYSDLQRLSNYRVWGIISFLLMLLLAVLQLVTGIKDDSRRDGLLHGLIGGFVLITIVSGSMLLINVTKMIKHLRTEELKGSLRAAAYDRDMYDSQLERSLTMSGDGI